MFVKKVYKLIPGYHLFFVSNQTNIIMLQKIWVTYSMTVQRINCVVKKIIGEIDDEE